MNPMLRMQELVLRTTKYLPSRGSLASYLIAAALTVIALGARLAMAPVDAGLQYIAFFPAVTLAAMQGGLGPGVLATIVGALLASFIFTPPYYTLSWFKLQNSLWSNIVFFVDGLVVCTAIDAMYRYQLKYLGELDEARRNAERLAVSIQALRDSEAFSRSIFDSRSEQVAILDDQGVIVAVNDAWHRFATANGAPEGIMNAVGLNYLSVCAGATGYPGGQDALTVATAIRAILSGTLHDFAMEYPCHAPDEERWFNVRITPLEGSRPGVVVAHENISRRKAMERTLQHHAAIVESSEDAIFSETLDGVITSWNQGAERIFGYSHGEAVGRHVHLLLTPEAYQAEERQILEGIRCGTGVRHLQTVRQRKDGTPIDISVTISPLRDAEGKIIGASKVARDISAQKRADQELRIAAIAFEAQEGMMVTDANNIVLRINSAFTRNTGYTAEEVIGRHVRFMKSGRHGADFYAAMWQSIGATGAWQGEVWNRRKNGEIYPEWLTVTAVKNEAGEIINYVGTHTDITIRKAAEDEIKHLAFYDPLTRLPNRRLLMDRLHHALGNAARTGHKGAVMFIDMDNFKTLNDTLGHDQGDLLLQQVAQRLSECVRDSDTVARFGGDEFVVMLELLNDKPRDACLQVAGVADKILTALNATYELAGHAFRSTPSIGITLFGEQPPTAEELLKQADSAMYEAKKAGRNNWCFYRAVCPMPERMPPG